MAKLPFRYFNGEAECPFRDTQKQKFWWMERNLSFFPEERVERIFGETNPVNWPPFMEKAKGTFRELAAAYVIWLDYAVHVWGGNDGGLEWLHYFDEPVKGRLSHITWSFKVDAEENCPCEDKSDEDEDREEE